MYTFVDRILVLRTAPLEQMVYGLSEVRKNNLDAEVTCISQPELAEVLDEVLKVNDFISYNRKFFKLYWAVGILRQVRRTRYTSLLYFYNNELHTGYFQVELFCLFTGISKIIFCDATGKVVEHTRWSFLKKTVLARALRLMGNVFTFFVVWGALLVAGIVFGLRWIFRLLMKKK